MTATYSLSDVAAMKSKPYTYGGFEWSNVGTIPEAAWETVPEPAPAPPKCPHCGRDFHTAPLTKRVADMVRNHHFDPTYRAAEDESPVECVGSDTYGPNRPYWGSGGGGAGGTWASGGVVWLDQLISTTLTFTTDVIAGITGLQMPKWEMPNYGSFSWSNVGWHEWFAPSEELPACPPELEVDVQFGPEHWPVEHVLALFPPHLELVAKVHPNEWREATPLPASPGLDVSALAEQFNEEHNGKVYWK